MTREVGACRAFDGADQGAKIMWERDCGAVPVLDQEGAVVAMLTDRDLCMAAMLQGKALSEIRVSSAMSKDLWYCRPDDDLSHAEEVMRLRKVRRLPVVDAHGKLLGILSLSDIARASMDRQPGRPRKRAVKPSDVGTTLGAISSAGH
ncbi:MAG TPA: CBS domain-containing protein [Vicinamibacteria bacterium]